MGLRFTDEEEREFQEMTKLQPVGIGQHLGVWADKIANTVGMFLCLLLFSILAETVFKGILNQMLFISNTYQLVALPILGIATGLSTMIILRFLFRILLELRKEFAEVKAMHKELRDWMRTVNLLEKQRTEKLHQRIEDLHEKVNR